MLEMLQSCWGQKASTMNELSNLKQTEVMSWWMLSIVEVQMLWEEPVQKITPVANLHFHTLDFHSYFFLCKNFYLFGNKCNVQYFFTYRKQDKSH